MTRKVERYFYRFIRQPWCIEPVEASALSHSTFSEIFLGCQWEYMTSQQVSLYPSGSSPNSSDSMHVLLYLFLSHLIYLSGLIFLQAAFAAIPQSSKVPLLILTFVPFSWKAPPFSPPASLKPSPGAHVQRQTAQSSALCSDITLFPSPPPPPQHQQQATC